MLSFLFAEFVHNLRFNCLVTPHPERFIWGYLFITHGAHNRRSVSWLFGFNFEPLQVSILLIFVFGSERCNVPLCVVGAASLVGDSLGRTLWVAILFTSGIVLKLAIEWGRVCGERQLDVPTGARLVAYFTPTPPND